MEYEETCTIFGKTYKSDRAAEAELAEDPEGFLYKFGLSTEYVQQFARAKGDDLKNTPDEAGLAKFDEALECGRFPFEEDAITLTDMIRPPIKNFGLSRVGAQGRSYFIYPDPLASKGPKGYFLLTKEQMVTIPALAQNVMVLSEELTGCSLYVRYDKVTESLIVFHHLRKFAYPGPGGEEILRDSNGNYVVAVDNDNPKSTWKKRLFRYTDVLKYEEYGPTEVMTNTQPLEFKHTVTPIIYKKEGVWMFGYQLIQTQSPFTKLPIEKEVLFIEFKTRAIQGVPPDPI